jgi:hypothetical protein
MWGFFLNLVLGFENTVPQAHQARLEQAFALADCGYFEM